MKISSSLGFMHLIGWVLVTLLNTYMVFAPEKNTRMFILIAVVILQFLTLFLFMVDYDKLGSQMWKKKEQALIEKFQKSYLMSRIKTSP